MTDAQYRERAAKGLFRQKPRKGFCTRMMMSDSANCSGQRIPSKFLRDLDGFCRDSRCKICSKKLPSKQEARRAVLHNLAIVEELSRDAQEQKVLGGIQSLLGDLWDEHYWEWRRVLEGKHKRSRRHL
jgi:hypothetical protein